MYQVIEMVSANEPWWFFEDWQKDIVKEEDFFTIEQALEVYKRKWRSLSNHFEKYKRHGALLTAFYDTGELYWCESCEADLQIFHGLMLLQDYEKINVPSDKDG